ncbi:hypothetical protein [Campylobacter upsaliensis]|uniref:hypothetical protein n=1 Tax=Campylobacter upsaliensis TaxID=28080 RepID=UPI0022EB886A|nr:hypothetical protein [Campylobacter upsaliensis]
MIWLYKALGFSSFIEAFNVLGFALLGIKESLEFIQEKFFSSIKIWNLKLLKI